MANKTKQQWLLSCSPSDQAAIREMLDNRGGVFTPGEVLEAVLSYNGHGMSVERFRAMADAYPTHEAEERNKKQAEIVGALKVDLIMTAGYINHHRQEQDIDRNIVCYGEAIGTAKALRLLGHETQLAVWDDDGYKVCEFVEIDGKRSSFNPPASVADRAEMPADRIVRPTEVGNGPEPAPAAALFTPEQEQRIRALVLEAHQTLRIQVVNSILLRDEVEDFVKRHHIEHFGANHWFPPVEAQDEKNQVKRSVFITENKETEK